MTEPIRFVRHDKSGRAIEALTERQRDEQCKATVDAFAASNALYRRGYNAGFEDAYVLAMKVSGVRFSRIEDAMESEERHLAKAREILNAMHAETK